jgi:GNAT superfamily N-acetyltransferase
MITVKEISTKKELKQFVKFPFKLYKNNKYWVPPIIKEEVDSFNKTKNPVFEHADARFFLAYNKDTIVGRITAIINWIEVKEQKVKKMRFGWFDFIDDPEVSKSLLKKIITIGKENNLEFIEGPVGFSNLDKVGVLTYGFDYIGTMVTWYNYPYYEDHYKRHGLEVSKKYIEDYFLLKNVDIKKYIRINKILKTRYKLRELNFTASNDIIPYVDEMFSILNSSYSKLSTFIPVTNKQIAYFKKKFIPFINPRFIKFVVDEKDQLVAFAITMPSFAKALQKAKGKLFPNGIFHLLKARRQSDAAVLYLIGVIPEYQNKGVTSIIFEQCYNSFDKLGIKKGFITPELEDNKEIHLIWRHFNPVIHKKRCTFKLDIK